MKRVRYHEDGRWVPTLHSDAVLVHRIRCPYSPRKMTMTKVYSGFSFTLSDDAKCHLGRNKLGHYAQTSTTAHAFPLLDCLSESYAALMYPCVLSVPSVPPPILFIMYVNVILLSRSMTTLEPPYTGTMQVSLLL